MSNKYLRELTLNSSRVLIEPWQVVVKLDVYDVLRAFKTESAAVDHAVKKLLAPGERGAKTRTRDIKEAIASLHRELETLAIGKMPEPPTAETEAGDPHPHAPRFDGRVTREKI